MKTRMALFAAAVLAGVCSARADEAGPLGPTQAADQPKGAPKRVEEKPDPAQPTPQSAESLSEKRPKGGGQPLFAAKAPQKGTVPDGSRTDSKTDRERMVGSWFIVNDDSRRRGEMWVITEDSIVMHAMEDGFGADAVQYTHRLDAGKNPKQIDITVSRVKGPTVGVIKGIYVLEEDELRLCLGEMGKDRPAAFPEKPKPGEVLVLRRASSGATPPAATDAVPRGAQDGEPTRKVLTPEEAIKQRPKEPVTVRFKVDSVQDESRSPGSGFGVGFIFLKDGGSFSVRIIPPAMDTIMRLDIEPAKHFTGKFVWVTGLVQPDSTGSSFHIGVDDLDKSQFAVLKE